MTVHIDFTLNGRRFGVVEQAIFRLVLNGMTSARRISDLLCVFSDEAIAGAIQNLVCRQLLCADVPSRTLSLSEAVLATIDTCLSNPLNLPDSLAELMSEGTLHIDDETIKEAIMAQLLPGTKPGFLTKCLDFHICGRGENIE